MKKGLTWWVDEKGGWKCVKLDFENNVFCILECRRLNELQFIPQLKCISHGYY